MMGSFGHCEETTSDPIVVREEKRSRIVFKNTLRRLIRIVQIDGCVITQGPRCDYLFISCNATEYYVELKGCNIRHAVRQIEATIPQVSCNPIRGSKHAIIVSARCPVASPQIQQLQRRFKKRFCSSFTIKNGQHEVDI